MFIISSCLIVAFMSLELDDNRVMFCSNTHIQAVDITHSACAVRWTISLADNTVDFMSIEAVVASVFMRVDGLIVALSSISASSLTSSSSCRLRARFLLLTQTRLLMCSPSAFCVFSSPAFSVTLCVNYGRSVSKDLSYECNYAIILLTFWL